MSLSLAGLQSRHAALEVIRAIVVGRHALDDAFDRNDAIASLADRDRAFAFKLISTTLRRLGQIDALIDMCLDRPLSDRLMPVRSLMRLGIAQLLFLHTPPHAAVDTTVTLARRTGYAGHAALINAVLRRLAKDGQGLIASQDAARLNTPEWLWQAWVAAYGETTACAIAAAHLEEPPLDITPKRDTECARLSADLGATCLATGSLRLYEPPPVPTLPGYELGDWWVQDAAAALPAKLLGNVRGRRILDLCAAPGGKTAQLAAGGALVTAVDRSPKRLQRLSENLRRLALPAEVVAADATHWRPPQPAEAILLDVPCSASGTIRRHPDIAILKSPDEISVLAKVQERLLAAAADMLIEGGILIYCVCSLQPEEGARVVDSLLSEGLPLVRMPIQPAEIGGYGEFLTSAGDLRTLPCHLGDAGGIDGFYASRLRRQ